MILVGKRKCHQCLWEAQGPESRAPGNPIASGEALSHYTNYPPRHCLATCTLDITAPGAALWHGYRNPFRGKALALHLESAPEPDEVTLNAKLLVLAIAAQVLLTLIILVLMGRERVPRVRSGEIPAADIAVERTAYPLYARLLSNSFDNQFQLPVLFYLAAILTLVFTSTSWIELVLAWLFVALRYAHAFVHVTTNRVYRRFALYTAGLAVLALLWLWLVLRLLVLTPSV